MLNQVVLAGRLIANPIIEEKEGKKYAIITVAVPRPYKNIDGIYETDFIDCRLWNVIAENTCEYCRKGDVVGIKGTLQTEIENDIKKNIVIAEKVSFLSSRKED